MAKVNVMIHDADNRIGVQLYCEDERYTRRFVFTIQDGRIRLVTDDDDFRPTGVVREIPYGLEQAMLVAMIKREEESAENELSGWHVILAEIMAEMYWKISDFRTGVRDFLNKFGEVEKNAFFRNIAAIASPFAQKHFEENPSVHWLIIAHRPDGVIADGSEDEKPTVEELARIAYIEEVPVVLCERQGLVTSVAS